METIKQLLNLLEENGFENSDENLDILIEGLENQTIIILDSSNLSLSEGMDEDYLYMQLLDNNGFKINENNINVLKEAINNGHILLSEDAPADAEQSRRIRRKKIRKALGITAGLAAGAFVGGMAGGAGGAMVDNATRANHTTAATSALNQNKQIDEILNATKEMTDSERLAYFKGKGYSDELTKQILNGDGSVNGQGVGKLKELNQKTANQHLEDASKRGNISRNVGGGIGTVVGGGAGAYAGSKIADKSSDRANDADDVQRKTDEAKSTKEKADKDIEAADKRQKDMDTEVSDAVAKKDKDLKRIYGLPKFDPTRTPEGATCRNGLVEGTAVKDASGKIVFKPLK